MKKANYTFRCFTQYLSIALIGLLATLSPNLSLACEMSCTQAQQVSLDENCEAEITPQLILSDDGESCGDEATFSVAVRKTMNGPNLFEGPTVIVDGSEVNNTLIVEITAVAEGVTNRCWGTILLEDKLAPSVNCEDVTISCNDEAALTPPIFGAECGDFTVNLIGQTPDVNLCTDDVLRTFEQTFTATDAQGNTSPAPCTRLVTVERIDIDAIEFPANLRVTSDNALACDSNYLRIEPGSIIPDPSFSGVPTLDSIPLIPTANFNCNTVVTFSDVVLPQVGGITKVMRTFVVSEWICGTDEITDSTQIIEIVDDEGPAISPLNDITISTSTGSDCEAAYLLPAITAVDNCNELDRIDIAYPGGFIEDYDGAEMITLPRGSNLITVTAYDNYTNSSQETFTVVVDDRNAPVAVCDQNTVVALSSNPNGLTEVFAPSFDDGSYDECGLAIPSMMVKRMDDGGACAIDGDQFSGSVFFCCADIGTNTQVIFQVTDLDGNTNTCMVNVEVQDKLPAAIQAPANITVNCDEPFELTEQGLIVAFGDATATDNCGDSIALNYSFSDLRNDCNVGEIRRFFSDPANGATQIQSVFFVNDDPFNVEEDIAWPADVTINECFQLAMGMATEDLPEVAPDVTGEPILTRDACDMVGISYDDRVFEMFNSSTASCFKIIRTFTIDDWCQDTTVSYSQSIMITNSIAPTLQLTCDPITASSFDEECEDGQVILRMAATDDCTPAEALSWQYTIDAFNDGTLDIVSDITSGSSIDSLNGEEVSMIDASGDYPIGNHRIIWTVEDRCGNITRCEQLFSVVNSKTPTPYCYNGLAIEIMGVDTDGIDGPDAGMIDIWASDFDAGSFHGCGYDVTVSFSPDPLDTGRTYTCDDLGQQPVEIWATAVLPDGSVVQDFCTSYIIIQDNMNVCSGLGNGGDEEEEEEGSLFVGGNIATESNEFVEQVEVQIRNMDMLPAMTNEFGDYQFNEMNKGGSYDMKPFLDKDHLNGVTTIDLVLMQRYILGLNELDSPYKIIAADINNDGVVSAQDLLTLRKTILGINKSFVNNTSWKFLEKDYTFINPAQPLKEHFAEGYKIFNLEADMDIDFVGVKVGDVNNTVSANANLDATVRSAGTLNISFDHSEVEKEGMARIPVYSNNFDNVYAYQFTFDIEDNVEVLSFEAGALNVTNANFGMQKAAEGLVSTSWDDYQGRTVSDDEPLFFINVKVNGSVANDALFGINSDITKAEAYGEAGVLEVNVTEREMPTTEAGFVLHQNKPNPFTDKTVISFELPEAGNATLSVFDVTGKMITTITSTFNKGANAVELNAQDLNANGVLYYTLKTENQTATNKMVVIK